MTALIPIIKKRRPDAKIIFRSHIQSETGFSRTAISNRPVQSDLTDKTSTEQHRTWNYLFDFVKDVDLFLAHPVKFFVPKNVLDNLPVLYMAPSTDPLDGLNKMYGHASLRYYRQYFNALSQSQCGVTIDWDRGYICQIARFDPSKGDYGSAIRANGKASTIYSPHTSSSERSWRRFRTRLSMADPS